MITTTMTIPQTQTAAVIPLSGATSDVQLQIKTDHPVPLPSQGEILVKIEYSGVCHSDVHSIRGETPMLTDVAGHEGVGMVVAGTYLLTYGNLFMNCFLGRWTDILVV
jgi:propanol-preferring alcohol dehydrogenase